MSGPLDSIRIIDLTNMGMGPYATEVMADLGADVVKVESPQGDPIRGVGPMRNPRMGSAFLHINRNKRSVVLDLKKPKGLQALLKLAESSDVLVYNVRPPAMARLGLDYASVAAVNPRIIYCGVYGFGQEGPYGEKPAYDDMIQGLSAIPSLEARLGGNPRYVPMAMADQTVGLVAAYTVLAALVCRANSGKGQAVEVPMFESMAQFVLACHMCGQTYDPPLGEAGFVRHLTPERRPFPTQDGFICMVPYNDEQWFRFFDLVGRPELRSDLRFSNVTDRTRNIGQLYAIVAEVLSTGSTAEWMKALAGADIPAMPLHTLDSLMADPHLAKIGFFQWTDHPTEGRIRTMEVPTNWSATPPRVRRQAPNLGEHSVEVLREAGYSEEEIRALVAEGATHDGRPGAKP